MKTNCGLPFHRLKIDSDGRYQNCCHQSSYYGNVLDNSWNIESMFKNRLNIEVQNKCINNELHDICNNTKCPVYYTDKISKYGQLHYDYPNDIELALPPTWCNIGGFNPTPDTACFMCPRSSKNFNKWFNTNDNTDRIIEKIKPAMPYLKNLSILGLAEPFFQGKIFDVFDKLDYKKYKSNIHFWTFTNGNLFIEKYQEKFLDYVAQHNLAFSIDAATSETYRKIRRVDMFEQTWKNIESYWKKIEDRICIYKDDISTYDNLIKGDVDSFVTANINKINLHEMPEIIKRADSIGVHRIQFLLTHETVGDTPTDINKSDIICNENNWQEFWEMQLFCEELSKDLKIRLEFYLPFHKGYKNDI